jgi:tetratricopeptide (TPR) repeat protein
MTDAPISSDSASGGQDPEPQLSGRGRLGPWLRLGLPVAIVTLAIGFLWIWGGRSREQSAGELLNEARNALRRGDFSQAKELARRVLDRDAASNEALVVAARAAAAERNDEESAGYFRRLREYRGDDAVDVYCEAGGICLDRLGRLTPAERHFRKALSIDPQSAKAIGRLSYLLKLTGRYREARSLDFTLIRQGKFDADLLVDLEFGDTLAPNAAIVKWLADCHRKYPDDPLPMLGLARDATFKGQPERAVELLQRVVRIDPSLAEAQAALGQLLLETHPANAYLRWRERLPKQADGHPLIWLVRGLWAQRQQQDRAAVRCYWEAARRDGRMQNASFQLARTLKSLKADTPAERFVDHCRRLDETAALIKAFHFDRTNGDRIPRIAALLETQGRLREAWAWWVVALRLRPDSESLHKNADRLKRRLDRNEWMDVVMNPAADCDLSNYPLPSGRISVSEDRVPDRNDNRESASIVFVDRAKQAGLQFSYLNGGKPKDQILRMYESNGGGVAILDFDNDGWPDIYLTQGGTWPPQRGDRAPRDVLFRNLGNGRFVDVTQSSGLGDEQFSQGATVGDFDNDGFPDAYVANIGGNRFYRNNGDGTFSDVTGETNTAGNHWSTSCLLADLNGDGNPDLYVVNYLQGADVFTRVCRDRRNRPATCTPDVFPAAPDQIYLNLGDGRFERQTESAGINVPNGKGLGIVAADFNGSGRLHLFVANDQVPNFYFVNRSTSTALKFDERGVASGLAYDRDGRSQASMGIAADDYDGDGRLDLFVTNFYREPNTLYRNLNDYVFADVTRSAGLWSPSLPMLGFGTQFLDADLDGWPDLVVGNGHVTNVNEAGTPFRMQPQFFRNINGKGFREKAGRSIGAYFTGEYLGRSLATLDWNRDSRPDFVVTHLDAPVALLTNESPRTGNALVVTVRGVRSSRDAFGTTIRIRSGTRVWVKQLTAGDGFQASNQKQLIFGLGKLKTVNELRVRWPSGIQQVIPVRSADRDVLLIEGQAEAKRLR